MMTKGNDYFYHSQALVWTSKSIEQHQLPSGGPWSISLRITLERQDCTWTSLQHRDSG